MEPPPGVRAPRSKVPMRASECRVRGVPHGGGGPPRAV